MIKFLIASVALVLAAGCSTKPMFVYKPSPAAVGGRNLPVKLAVLPFSDGTEDFTKRGSVLAPEELSYNLAKTGIQGGIDALTPEYWAKAFAEETAASGDFRSVRFVYAGSELSDEDYRIEGTVEKATIRGGDKPNEFAIRIRACRADGRDPLWEMPVSRKWKKTAAQLLAECGKRDVACWRELHTKDLDRAMREIFTEARAGLVRALAPLPENVPGSGGMTAVPSEPPPAPESADETIEGILKGK